MSHNNLLYLQQGRTPLIAASDSGFADIVKLLVDKISELPDEERQKYLDYKKHVSKLKDDTKKVIIKNTY